MWKEFMIDEELETMDIGFLRDHVAQITENLSQLCLKPGEEEDQEKRMVAVLEIQRP